MVIFWKNTTIATVFVAVFRLVTGGDASASECYNVATWNLEHFEFTKVRSGFPETMCGGPSYSA